MKNSVLIRPEEGADWFSVHALNKAAFNGPDEAKLVDALRKRARPLLSLVAEENGMIVGHILFSPVTLSSHPDLNMMGLAPMAVAPERQRQGIGSALVRHGVDGCRELGVGAVVVLGHPSFYPRFGFVPAAHFGIDCEYKVPKEAFLVVELQPGYLRGVSGTIRYHAAFNAL